MASLVSNCTTSVYVAGDNSIGQLGFISDFEVLSFNENPALSGTVQIASGFTHTLALLENGNVLSFGSNNYGELGFGDFAARSTPTLIPNLNNVKSIYAGFSNSIVILNDGSVYVFGDNYYGALGLGANSTSISIPTLNSYLNGNQIQKIAISFHTLVLLTNGSVIGFGYNRYGELSPEGVLNLSVPTLLPNLNNVIDIAVGSYHSLFLLSNGSVFSCGDNSLGQLGIGVGFNQNTLILIPSLNNIIQVCSGSYFSYAISSNGSMFSWGNNFDGELGLRTVNMSQFIPLVSEVSNIIHCLTEANSGFILLGNGTIMGVGSNDLGQLGAGTFINLFSFTPISFLNALGNIQFQSSKLAGDSSLFIQSIPVSLNTVSKHTSLITVIVIPIVLIFLILLISFVILFLYLRKRKNSPTQTSNIELRDSIKANITLNAAIKLDQSNRVFLGSYTGKEVALKKIKPTENSTFINEVHILKKLGSNPYTVGFYGIFEENSEKYMVLELLNSSLFHFFQIEKNIPTERLMRYIYQISACLSYLEEKEIIHGNVCCDNILRKDTDRLKLCDFELSHTLYNPITLSENNISRIQFCPPEVKNNRKYHKKSDQWSWSVTCIQIFYLNDNNQSFQLNEQILSSKPSQCPDDLWDFIRKGLSSNPILRPTFKEIIETLTVQSPEISSFVRKNIVGSNEGGYLISPLQEN